MNDAVSQAPVNILYCEGNTDGTVGGSFFSLLYLVSGLDRKQFNPIVVFHNEHALLEQYHRAGVETLIIPRPVPMNIARPDNRLLRMFYPLARIFQKAVNFLRFFPLTGLQYARLMKQRNIRLLHLNNSIIRNNDWMLGAQLAGVRCITHERGINRHYPRLARYYARRLDAIICISNAVRDNLRDKNIDPGNLVTIYNAIDPQVVQVDKTEQQIRQQHGIDSTSRLIGVIGNIKEWKGQETAIRAMPEVLQQFPDTICLLVGDTAVDDQYYKERLLALIDQLGIDEHIIFTGYTRNVANYLNAMQLVLHTSVEPEPFGRVLIEAMSMKKPVIGTRAGAVPEIIEEGKTGFTFVPGDHETLGKAITRLLSEPTMITQMGELGYQRLLDQFHISVNVANTEKLYRKILG